MSCPNTDRPIVINLYSADLIQGSSIVAAIGSPNTEEASSKESGSMMSKVGILQTQSELKS